MPPALHLHTILTEQAGASAQTRHSITLMWQHHASPKRLAFKYHLDTNLWYHSDWLKFPLLQRYRCLGKYLFFRLTTEYRKDVFWCKKNTPKTTTTKNQVDESNKCSNSLNSSRNISVIMIWLIKLFELVTSVTLRFIIYYIS